MSLGSQSVHIVSTSFDYAEGEPEHDRIGHMFKEESYSASKIYVLYNENVKGADDKLEKKALKGVRNVLEENTDVRSNRGIENVPTDYYSFEESFLATYELIYREQRRDNKVFVNLSGGTKPLAIGMAFACGLAETELSPFYVAKEYEQTNAGLKKSGLVPTVDISKLDILDFEGIVPDDEHAQQFLVYLLNSSETGVAELLIENDVIERKRKSDDINGRRSTINRYHHRVNDHLVPTGLVEKNDEVSLTSKGRLVARILDVRRRVDDVGDE